MRVLSVTVGDEIRIAEEIVIKVVHIGESRVKIGVTAPDFMPVFREELLQRNRDTGIEEW